MAIDERQQQESRPQGQQPKSQYIRPKIQRKSPKTTKAKQDVDRTVTSTAVEIEETRKRLKSWMGLGSKKGAQTSNDQKTTNKEGNASELKIESKNDVLDLQKKIKSNQLQQKKPVSILKSPKYSSKSQILTGEAPTAMASTTSISIGGCATVSSTVAPSNDIPTMIQQQRDGEAPGIIKQNKPAFICKDIVVERDPAIAATKMKSFRQNNKSKHQNKSNYANYSAIEGYVPISSGMESHMALNRDVAKRGDDDTQENKTHTKVTSGSEKDNDPLIIDSLEELMRAAGETLPENPNKITEDTKVVEANVSFSVMTKDQYENNLPAMKEEQEEERKRQLEVFMGKHDIFGDEEDDDESIEGALDGDIIEDDDDADDADAAIELLLGSDINDDDENDDTSTGRQPEIRAFTLLWDALTNWMTHDTVLWVKALRDSHQKGSSSTNNSDVKTSAMLDNNNNLTNIDAEWSPMVDRSDIGASRCAGVSAMIRLYLGKCMEELNRPMESRRTAVKRLNDIMRTFDYSRENPKLSAGHWKAMACVLLDAVLIESREADSALIRIPPSVANVGMSKEEFEYLSRKAVLIFQ